ncbi:MAG: GreA/GreB family elongation factor [Thermomicrobiales bacterium]
MVAENETQLTEDGMTWLKQEIRELRDERIPELAQAVQTSAEDGDLTDNSDWEASKDEYVRAEQRLADLELALSQATPAKSAANGMIGIGSRVTVSTTSGEEFTWLLVNPIELSVSDDRISAESPVGHALSGKSVGSTASVTAPEGEVTYTVVAVN